MICILEPSAASTNGRYLPAYVGCDDVTAADLITSLAWVAARKTPGRVAIIWSRWTEGGATVRAVPLSMISAAPRRTTPGFGSLIQDGSATIAASRARSLTARGVPIHLTRVPPARRETPAGVTIINRNAALVCGERAPAVSGGTPSSAMSMGSDVGSAIIRTGRCGNGGTRQACVSRPKVREAATAPPAMIDKISK